MKKLLFVLVCVLTCSCYSQNPLFNGFIDDDNFSSNQVKSSLCNSSSSSEFWTNPLNFVPATNTPTYTVHLNFIIIQDDNGNGNYPNNQDTYDFFNTAVNILNYTYANLVQTTDPDCFDFSSGQPNYVSNIKIQFEFDIIFKRNTSYWGDINISTLLLDEINNDPTIVPGINVILTIDENAYNSMVINDIDYPSMVSISWANFPSWQNMNDILYLVSPNSYTKTTYNTRHCLDIHGVSEEIVLGWMTSGTGNCCCTIVLIF